MEENISAENIDLSKTLNVTEGTKGLRTKKKKRKLSKKSLIILLLPILAAEIACAAVLFTMNKVYEYEFETAAAQYYMDNRYQIPAGSVLKTTDSNEIALIRGDNKETISNIPIYLDGQSTLILPEQMIYVNPRNFEFKKVPAFTVITNKNGSVILDYGNDSYTADGGFLFDGKDLYIFFEPMEVTYNDVTVELSRLSYSEAVYKGLIVNFDSESSDSYYEATRFEIVAVHSGKDYTISLLSDTVENYKGEKCLLFTDADELFSIFD